MSYLEDADHAGKAIASQDHHKQRSTQLLKGASRFGWSRAGHVKGEGRWKRTQSKAIFQEEVSFFWDWRAFWKCQLEEKESLQPEEGGRRQAEWGLSRQDFQGEELRKFERWVLNGRPVRGEGEAIPGCHKGTNPGHDYTAKGTGGWLSIAGSGRLRPAA